MRSMNISLSKAILPIGFLILALVSCDLRAADIVWDGGAGTGVWSDATNWSTDTVPSVSDRAIFSTGSDVVTIASPITVAGIEMSGAWTGSIVQQATVSLAGSWSVLTGTWDAGSQSVSVGGNATIASTATFVRGTSTIHLTGTGSVSNPAIANGFHILSCGAAGKTTTIADTLVVRGQCQVGPGVLDLRGTSASRYLRLYGSGDMLQVSGTLIGWWVNGGQIWYESDSTTPMQVAGGNYGQCAVWLITRGAHVGRFEQQGSIGNCHFVNTLADTSGGTVEWHTNSHDLACTVYLSLGGGISNGGTVLYAGASHINTGSNFAWFSNPADQIHMEASQWLVSSWGVWSPAGQVIPGTSQVTVTGASLGVSWRNDITQRFYDLVLQGAGVIQQHGPLVADGSVNVSTGTWELGGSAATIAGDLTVANGAGMHLLAQTVSVGGDCTFGPSSVIQPGAATLRMTGTGVLATSGTGQSVHHLEVGFPNQTTSLGSDVTVTATCVVAGGTFDLRNAGTGHILHLQGSGDVLTNNGVLQGAWANGGQIWYEAFDAQPVHVAGTNYGQCGLRLVSRAGASAVFEQQGGISNAHFLTTDVDAIGGSVTWHTNDFPVSMTVFLTTGNGGAAKGPTTLHAGASVIDAGSNFAWFTTSGDIIDLSSSQWTARSWGAWTPMVTVIPGTSRVTIRGAQVGVPWRSDVVQTFHDLVLNAIAPSVPTAVSGPLQIAGTTTLTAGTLRVPATTASFLGDVIATAGHFDASGASAILAGNGNQSADFGGNAVADSLLLQNGNRVITLGGIAVQTWSVPAATTVNVTSGDTVTVAQALVVSGSTGQPVLLGSTASGNAWFLDVAAGAWQAVTEVQVTDSDASAGAAIDATQGGVDLGGNTNWIFTPVGGAPTVAIAATATPNPITGITTQVSVLGDDDAGESNLTYAWTAAGPATVSFDASETNAAKQTTATFASAGTYTLTATITDATNQSVTSSVVVEVQQTFTAIQISPTSATLSRSGSQAFMIMGQDQFTQVMTAPAPVWSVTGIGSVDAAGHYTAGTTLGDATVTAAVGALTSSATVAVTNAAPTIAVAPHASPSVVTGTTSNVSVLGADDAGEAGLSYDWTVTSGPTGVLFSADGTHAAKETMATFPGPGDYTFQVVITDADNALVTASVDVSVVATVTTVQVAPSTATVEVGETQAFTATVLDQFSVGVPSASVTWSVTPGASIDTAGHLVAGTNPGTVTVIATSGVASGTASVTIGPAGNLPPTITANAAATPDPVTGVTTALSVSATDDGGAANLNYTWTVLSGPAVNFSTNNSTTAQHADVIFSSAGDYTFLVTVTDTGGLSVEDSISVVVAQTPTSLAVSPQSATVQVGSTLAYVATVTDQFDVVMATPITWSVNGSSTIDATGILTAGSVAENAIITAVSGALFGTAQATIEADSGDTTGTSPEGDGYADGDRRVSPHPWEISISTSGFDAFSDPIGASVDGARIPVRAMSRERFLVEVPLDPTKAVSVKAGVIGSTGAISGTTKGMSWQPTILNGFGVPLTIRQGDSLLLTTPVSDDSLVSYTFSNGAPAIAAPAKAKVPVRFDTVGQVVVTATDQGKTTLGELTVIVVGSPFNGQFVPCEVQVPRTISLSQVPQAQEMRFLSADQEVLLVSGGGGAYDAQGTADISLEIEPLQRGTPQILVRLLSDSGPVLSLQEVDEFILERRIADRGLLRFTGDAFGPNGIAREGFSQLVMRPWIPNLQVALEGTITYLGNGYQKSYPIFLTSAVAESSGFQQVADETEMESVGVYTFAIPAASYVTGLNPTVTGSVRFTPQTKSGIIVGSDDLRLLRIRDVTVARQPSTISGYITEPIIVDGEEMGTRVITGLLSQFFPHDFTWDFQTDVQEFGDDVQGAVENAWRDLRIMRRDAKGEEIKNLWDGGPVNDLSWPDSIASSTQASLPSFGYLGGLNGPAFHISTIEAASIPGFQYNSISAINGFKLGVNHLPGVDAFPEVVESDFDSGFDSSGFYYSREWNDSMTWMTSGATVQVSGKSPVTHTYWQSTTPGGNDPVTLVPTIIEADLPLNGPLVVDLQYSHQILITHYWTDIFEGLYGTYIFGSDTFEFCPSSDAAGLRLPAPTNFFQEPSSLSITKPGVYQLNLGLYHVSALTWLQQDGYNSVDRTFSQNPLVLVVHGQGVANDGSIFGSGTDYDATVQSAALPLTGLTGTAPLNSGSYTSIGVTSNNYISEGPLATPILVHAPLALSSGQTKDGIQDVLLDRGSSQPTIVASYQKLAAGLGLGDGGSASVPVIPGRAMVDVARGNLVFSTPIARFDTAGWGPDCDVTFNSQDATVTALGQGWRSTYDQRVIQATAVTSVITPSADVWYLAADGRRVLFQAQGSPTAKGQHYTSPLHDRGARMIRRLDASLSATGDWESGERWRLALRDQVWRYFDDDGRLVRMTNVRGESLRIQIDPTSHFPNEVVDDYGRTLDLRRAAFGESTPPGAPNDPLTGLAYSRTIEGGGIEQVSGSWAFAYSADNQKNLTQITMKAMPDAQIVPDGSIAQRSWNVTYVDKDGGVSRVATFTEPISGGTNLTTTINPRVDQGGNSFLVQVDHGQGGVSKLTYKTVFDSGGASGGHLVKWERSDQVPTSSNENGTDVAVSTQTRTVTQVVAKGRLVTSVTMGQRGTTMSYDDRGLLVRRVQSGAGASVSTPDRIETFVWGTLNQAPVIDPLDTAVLREHRIRAVAGIAGAGDVQDLVSLTEYADGGKSTGRVLRQTMPDGSTESYTYDTAGFAATKTDARNQTWTMFTKDAYGNVTTLQWPSFATSNRKDTWTYSSTGRVFTHIAGDGTPTRMEYDHLARIKRTEVGPDGQALFTAMVFDPFGRPISSTAGSESDGASQNVVATTTYDGLGRVVGTTQTGQGNVTITWTENQGTWTTTTTQGGIDFQKQRLDSSGRICEILVPHTRVVQATLTAVDQTPSLFSGVAWEVTRMAYHSEEGWMTSVTRADGGVTAFAEDGYGQVLQTTNALGGVATSTTNVLGWVLSATDPDNRTSYAEYDGVGRMRVSVSPSGARTITGYDLAGNKVSLSNGSSRGIAWGFDADGILVSTTDVFGQTTEVATNLSSRTREITLPMGITSTSAWNTKGQTTQNTAKLGTSGPSFTTEYEYPKDNGSITVTAPGRAPQTTTIDVPTLTVSKEHRQRLNGADNQSVVVTTSSDPNFGQSAGSKDVTFGAESELVYDAATRELNAVQDNRQSGGASRTTAMKVIARDRLGRAVLTEDGDHIRTLVVYDLLGRQKKTQRSGREPMVRIWSGVGEAGSDLLSVQTGSQAAMRFAYNALGQQVLAYRDGFPVHRSATYDIWGRQIEEARQQQWTRWYHDPQNGLATVRISSGGKRIVTELDMYGTPKKIRDDSTGQETVFDRSPDTYRISAVTTPAGQRREIDYDDTAGGDPKVIREVGTDGAVRTTTVLARDGSGAPIDVELPGGYQVRNEPSVWNEGAGPKGQIVVATVSRGGVPDEVTTTAADTAGRIRQQSLPGQAATTYAYTDGGRVETRGSTTYGYDPITGDLTNITQDGITTSVHTDTLGRVDMVSVPGVTRTYAFDAQAGWMTGMTQTVAGIDEQHQTTRDRDGRLLRLDEPGGVVIEYGYDDRDRLCIERRIASDGWLRQYVCDVRDNRVQERAATAGLQESAANFSGPGLPSQIQSVDGTWGVSTGRLQMSAPVGTTALATWDPGVEVLLRSVLHVSANPVQEFGQTTDAWIAPGIRLGTNPNGDALTVQVTFRRAGATLRQRAEVWAEASGGTRILLGATDEAASSGTAVLSLSLQPEGNLWLRLSSDVVSVPSDAYVRAGLLPGAYALTLQGEAASIAAEVIAWEWDGAPTASLSVAEMTYTNGDRLDNRTTTTGNTVAVETYAIDGFGRQTGIITATSVAGAPATVTDTSYGYDDLDRLTSVSRDGVNQAAYAYLGMSWRRRSATVGGQQTTFLWEGDDLRSHTLGGVTTTYGHMRGQPLWEQRGAAYTAYGRDMRGSVSGRIGYPTMPTDPDIGSYVWLQHRTYDAFGIATATLRTVDGDGLVSYLPASTIGTGFGYQGGWHDGATGLTQFQNRWYAPQQAGRWTQVDPAQAGMNWYAYAGGDPVNRMDPSGLDWVWVNLAAEGEEDNWKWAWDGQWGGVNMAPPIPAPGVSAPSDYWGTDRVGFTRVSKSYYDEQTTLRPITVEDLFGPIDTDIFWTYKKNPLLNTALEEARRFRAARAHGDSALMAGTIIGGDIAGITPWVEGNFTLRDAASGRELSEIEARGRAEAGGLLMLANAAMFVGPAAIQAIEARAVLQQQAALQRTLIIALDQLPCQECSVALSNIARSGTPIRVVLPGEGAFANGKVLQQGFKGAALDAASGKASLLQTPFVMEFSVPGQTLAPRVIATEQSLLSDIIAERITVGKASVGRATFSRVAVVDSNGTVIMTSEVAQSLPAVSSKFPLGSTHAETLHAEQRAAQSIRRHSGIILDPLK